MNRAREVELEWLRRKGRRHRARLKADPNAHRLHLDNRRSPLYWKYGLTHKDYDYQLELQGRVCAICKKPPKARRLAWDHDHKTGALRELLCSSCNGRLGWLELFMPSIVAYLKKHSSV